MGYITLIIKAGFRPNEDGNVALAASIAKIREFDVLAAWRVESDVVVAVGQWDGAWQRASGWFNEPPNCPPYPVGALLSFTGHDGEFRPIQIGESR